MSKDLEKIKKLRKKLSNSGNIDGSQFTIFFKRNRVPYKVHFKPSIMLSDFEEVITIKARSLGDAFYTMQDKIWNEMGEANALISELGLDRTSMMIDDLLRNEKGTFFEAESLGFVKIELKPFDMWSKEKRDFHEKKAEIVKKIKDKGFKIDRTYYTFSDQTGKNQIIQDWVEGERYKLSCQMVRI